MGLYLLSLLIDVVVLVCLGITIFYCLKLSKSMNAFRAHKTEMSGLIQTLSKTIDEALRAIDGLKIAGDKSGRELQKIINDSRNIAGELEIMNEAGNSLAARLERLSSGLGSAASPARVEEQSGFFIHDREFEEAESDAGSLPDDLESEAERDLLAALRKTKKTPGYGA